MSLELDPCDDALSPARPTPRRFSSLTPTVKRSTTPSARSRSWLAPRELSMVTRSTPRLGRPPPALAVEAGLGGAAAVAVVLELAAVREPSGAAVVAGLVATVSFTGSSAVSSTHERTTTVLPSSPCVRAFCAQATPRARHAKRHATPRTHAGSSSGALAACWLGGLRRHGACTVCARGLVHCACSVECDRSGAVCVLGV